MNWYNLFKRRWKSALIIKPSREVFLFENDPDIQHRLDLALSKHEVLGVGDGYIDLIVFPGRLSSLLSDLQELRIPIETVGWWFPRSLEGLKDSYKYGMGGPRNPFEPGFLAELGTGYFDLDKHGIDWNDESWTAAGLSAKTIQLVQEYMNGPFLQEAWYHERLYPGLWLHVPKSWKRNPKP